MYLYPLFFPMHIGPYQLENNLILAPMAGVSDRPFRELCKQFGAGLAVSEMVKIPIIANGDIDSAEKAQYVLDATGADAIMIGRAAQGNPWLFKQINHFLKTGKVLEKPTDSVIHSTLLSHLEQLYSFYGNASGVRMARKHISWYFKHFGSVKQHTKTTSTTPHVHPCN
jgi:tRNA-dihydrouridine synthase